MLLQLEVSYSLFSSFNNQKIKETLMEMGKTGIVDMRKVHKTQFKYNIPKDTKNEQVLFLNSFVVTKLYYTQPLNNFIWNVKSDEKVLNGYTCKKATTNFAGRDYVAWYVLEIPIANRPYKFNGLPGLILEIHQNQKHYHFKLVSLEKVNKEEAISFDNYIKVSEKHYNDHEKKYVTSRL